MKTLIALVFFGLASIAQAQVAGSDIIGGPNSPGGKVPVLKYYPGVYVRVYQIVINKQACSLVVSTTYNDTPAGQTTMNTTQVVCPNSNGTPNK
jgi:hypothetical protein